jgi:pimeloyl-ACP methyl ester carboxylesterase
VNLRPLDQGIALLDVQDDGVGFDVAAVKRLMISAALQTVDGAGHMVMLEQPHRVAGLLNVFLTSMKSQLVRY